jgi:hypothetical protein
VSNPRISIRPLLDRSITLSFDDTAAGWSPTEPHYY